MINQDAHPQDAAKKVASTLFGKLGSSPPSSKKLQFVLKETTAGSDKGEWAYVASRKKLDPPRRIEVGGKSILMEWEYSAKPI
jgi:hypothetical protein